MPEPSRAPDLLRGLGLSVDGPVLWGQPVRSRAPGLFVVEASSPSDSPNLEFREIRDWLERVPSLRLDGARPTPNELEARLADFWLPAQHVLYVGRTVKTLGARVAAAYATRLGDKRPHSGGYWLKTLHDVARLRVWWAETDAPEEYEDGLVSAIAASVSEERRGSLPDQGVILPWANLEAVTGERKATGISGALLDAEAASTPASKTTKATTRSSSGTTGSARSSSTTRRTTTSSRTSTTSRSTTTTGAPKPLPPPTHITASGLASLKGELDTLVKVERPAVILRVKSARELGDLRENADYEAARNEQSFLEGRIQALEQLIKTAQVIGGDRTGEVIIGSTVKVEADGEELTFRIVGSTEANPAAGRISNVSPVGKALVGRRAGDEVTIELPGHRQTYRVVEVA